MKSSMLESNSKRQEDNLLPFNNSFERKRNKTITQYEESSKIDYEHAIESPLLSPERSYSVRKRKNS